MNHNSPDRLTSVSEEDVRRLLKRAAELDAREHGTLTFVELQQIALEAGISPTAIEAAWIELQRVAEQPRAPDPNRTSFIHTLRARVADFITHFSRALETAGISLLSFITGYLTAPSDPSAPTSLTVVTTTGVLALVSLALAMHHRRNQNQSRFQTQLLVLWLFYWYGTLNGAPSVPDQHFLTLHGICWAALCLIGSVIVGRHRGRRDPNDPDKASHFAADPISQRG